jgi:general secretion pathway protein G
VRIRESLAIVHKNLRTHWRSALAIAVLAPVILVPLVIRSRNARKHAAAIQELSLIEKCLNRYYIDNGFYPTTDQGLSALMSSDPDELDPGMIIPAPPPSRRLRLLDPWGRPFEYTRATATPTFLNRSARAESRVQISR